MGKVEGQKVQKRPSPNFLASAHKRKFPPHFWWGPSGLLIRAYSLPGRSLPRKGSSRKGRQWSLAPNFCCCVVDQEKTVFKRNGPFLAHLPFWSPKWSNLLRISDIVL